MEGPTAIQNPQGTTAFQNSERSTQERRWQDHQAEEKASEVQWVWSEAAEHQSQGRVLPLDTADVRVTQ